MCGITGIWTSREPESATVDRVKTMTRCLAHRGPDDEGVNVVAREVGGGGPLVVFGHRRLSIMDLSAAGHQPMHDPVAGNWLTYNGEIYNFQELRHQLTQRGHVFHTSCDTEVIIKGFAEWGVGCWQRLRGIFAFGLWDARYRELHLVRDHMGIKPLYYYRGERGLVFASEVRTILSSKLVDGRLDPDGLNSFLKYGSVQEPCTLVRGIESVPPGHYMTTDAAGRTTLRHYWRLTECLVRNWEQRPDAAGVRAQLTDAVRRQMMADVPVGVFLSGGIDSTVVAALAAQAQPGAVRTFCIGVEQREFDESNEAAVTAKFLGCQHTTLMLEGKAMREGFTSALNCYDQPSYDGINSFFISQLVRQAGIKVALSGLGGDELFVGYEGFRKARQMHQLYGVTHLIPGPLRGALSGAFAGMGHPGATISGTLGELFDTALPSSYFSSRTLFSRRHILRLLDPGFVGVWDSQAWLRRERELVRDAAVLKGPDQTSFLELQTYMLSTLLRDADQMSMAHGLELRVPLIDPILIEHVLPIATEDKIKGRIGKQLLFEALGTLMPAEVFTRRKRGFTLPYREWMLRDLESAVGARFSAITPRGPWDARAYRKVWQDFKLGRVAWSRVLCLFVLEHWLEQNQICA
ncbi:MAG: asparagine synthase (glutamine-hydrolyzing) [Lacunisphaera sp.]|nr:asparagine synthase (glutamine-hydrolyzing) [Lacunisphaera sp.]